MALCEGLLKMQWNDHDDRPIFCIGIGIGIKGMGEAKKRNATNSLEFIKLDQELKELGINTDTFGFYDQDAFISQEKRDSYFLEKYARWVMLRPRDELYNAHVRRIVPLLTKVITAGFKEDNWHGSCVAASSIIARSLDRLGVWSFGVSGSLILEVKKKKIWRGFHISDFQDFPGAALGHAWVVAPPFFVLDATLGLQRWKEGDPMKDHIPDFIIAEDGVKIKPTLLDIVSAEMQMQCARRGLADSQLHHHLNPGLKEFGKHFPAYEVQSDLLTARYIPEAVRVSDVPLEQINSQGEIGRTGEEIWKQIVTPAFNL